ncbi:hypothetical protein F383_35387 [Gossypium arboreum]|uniref:Uncharacterized protein n=1 Tax=Gossypium arboreum TaxID=29729 RepID=A0A0B0PTQ4_GOSAR|nr:hypothetical protein F383_35387 [Gossypium arboreum]
MIISDMNSRKPHILWRDYQSRLNPPFYKLISQAKFKPLSNYLSGLNP